MFVGQWDFSLAGYHCAFKHFFMIDEFISILRVFLAYNRGSILQKTEIYSPPPQQVEVNETKPTIVLQPLHIAIGVCLIILILVAVLLHVVIVLHRRHRRLKRELIKQTQKIAASEAHQHWSPTLLDQPSGQEISLQQLKYSSAPSEQHRHHVSVKFGRLVFVVQYAIH